MRYWWLVLACCASASWAEDRFYPTVEANGQVRMLRTPEQPQAAPVEATATPATATPATEEGSESYVRSEDLERDGIKPPPGKKRFYYVPDGVGGSHVIESDAGVPLELQASSGDGAGASSVLLVSAEFQELNAAEVQADYLGGERCVSGRWLKSARRMLNKTDLWARDVDFEDRLPPPGVKAPTDKPMYLLQVRSFARSVRDPSYYMPVLIFLDAKGCALGGGWRYWMHQEGESQTHHAFIEGSVPVFEHTSYVFFVHPKEPGNLPFTLSREGALLLDILD